MLTDSNLKTPQPSLPVRQGQNCVWVPGYIYDSGRHIVPIPYQNTIRLISIIQVEINVFSLHMEYKSKIPELH